MNRDRERFTETIDTGIIPSIIYENESIDGETLFFQITPLVSKIKTFTMLVRPEVNGDYVGIHTEATLYSVGNSIFGTSADVTLAKVGEVTWWVMVVSWLGSMKIEVTSVDVASQVKISGIYR